MDPDNLEHEQEEEGSLRPRTLTEYVGQKRVKDSLAVFIEAARKRGEALDHVLLSGPPGLGKTTLAYILSREMGVNIKVTSGPVIERQRDLAAILTNLQEHDVLFIDEIHRLPNVVEEILYPAMEDYHKSWHSQSGSRFARHVTVATITPFLPDPAQASGAAVVVAPGGGFRTLSMENEGWNVARAPAERGVATFVLKYRLNQTPADMAGFERSMAEMFSGTARRPPRPDPQQMMAGLAPRIADARAAFALIRRRSAEWKIDPDRIGMVGFSAGAMLTMATALAGEDAKPAFIGNIYGPLAPVTVPADAPPLFVALAADDPFFANAGFGLIEIWRSAKKPAEFHLYEQGGHGFGMYPKETTSTGWFDAFVSWLTMHGMLKPRA